MPLDRDATLKTAEKLLRQGKLDAAIAEYQRVIDDQPRDWNTANTLGDLLLRAGKADKAVAQFARIADHLANEGFYPKANALYKKIIKIKPDDEHALTSAADISARQGLVADAKAFYTTVADRRKAKGDRRGAAEMRVKLGALDPADLEARVAGARANAELGETVEAANALRDAAAEFADKGQKDRALELLREAASLNPSDPQARRMLVQSYLVNGELEKVRELAGTAQELKQIAGELQERGQPDAALTLLVDVLRLDPADDDTRTDAMRACVAAGQIDRAMSLAPTAAWLRELASQLMLRGHQDRALDVLEEASRRDPSDEALKTELARAFIRRGDIARAGEYLTRDAAGQDPALLLTFGELELRRGHGDAGMEAVTAALRLDRSRRDEVVQLGWRLCEVDTDFAFQCVDLAALHTVEAGDWAGAAAALHEFVTRVPHHVPALMKLVEICVDGGLEATMYAAQAQLADAYLAAGLGSEARVIAEDLVAREPWERANIDRFRRALALLGESDPDTVIAERLAGQSPFMSTDMSYVGDNDDFTIPEIAPKPPAQPAGPEPRASAPPPPPGEPEPPPPVLEPFEPVVAARPAAAAKSAPAVAPAPRPSRPPDRPRGEGRTFELGPVSIDWSSILGEAEEPPPPPKPAPPRTAESVEVDLSEVLDDLRSAASAPAGGPMDQKPKPPGDLDSVFQEFRDEVSRQTALDAADQQFKLGQTYRDMGMQDEAIAELQKAARSPRRRFDAASIVARICKERGQLQQAIDWFERAAEAPAPDAESGRALLYDLASALEANGESARALAVFMELQADAGDYRDVRARVNKLTKTQTRG